MATTLSSDPYLRQVVDEARRQATELGELDIEPPRHLWSGLDPALQATVAAWVEAGGYERAVVRVVAEDPDLASQ